MSVRQSHALCAVVLLFAAACGGGGDSSGAAPQPPLRTVASVELALGATTLQAGASTQASATLRDSSGNVITGLAVSWLSSDPSVAHVSSTGLVSALAAGATTISAASQGKSAAAQLVVTAVPVEPVASVDVSLESTALHVGESTVATATARDAAGNALAGRSVTWSTSDAAVATVSASGAVTAVGAGTVTISATTDARIGSAVLTVTPAPVATVSVTLAPSSIHVGEAAQATAVVRDARGNVLTGRTITWIAHDPAFATVSASGVVTALGVGAAAISATCEGQTGSALLTVTPVPVASVSVTLARSSIFVGETTQATATVRDAAGNVLAGRSITFSTNNTAVATVSGTGLVSAVGAGVVTIFATSEGRVASTTLTVTLQPVATVTVTLAAQSLYVGQTTQATAVLRAADGSVLSGRTITWIPNGFAVAVSADGVVTATEPGTTTIVAFCEGKFGSASITVHPVPVASVSVTLRSPIYIGQTADATAVMRDAGGNVLYGRSPIWSSSNPSVAFMYETGIVKGISPGTAVISATSEGITGSASVTVLDVPVALRIAVDPPTTAAVREVLSPAPVVRLVNAAGADVANPGVSITVRFAGGVGALAGTTTRVTDATGAARFDDLSFTGRAVGTRWLIFSSPGLTEAASANMQVGPGAPAPLQAASALDQVAPSGVPVTEAPAVALRDVDGNAIPGSRVDFTVQGGGSITGSPATTDANGVARLASWTLGDSTAQEVTAIAAALPDDPVTFTATPWVSSGPYNVTLGFSNVPTSAQRNAFLRAKARIEAVVTGDVPSIYLFGEPVCGSTTLGPAVYDDLHIVVELGPIDGVSGILGQAGPCYVRSASRLPFVGLMRFDTADLASMEARGQLDAVILHEMMHVLGIGTVWTDLGLLAGAASDPVFLGTNARAAFLDWNGGAFYPGIPVPVENLGGIGTINSHWRESVFGRELMTGWITGASQPMSATTVESLRDLGYVVQTASADPFDIRSPLLRADALEPTADLTHDALPITIHEVDEQGRATPLVR